MKHSRLVFTALASMPCPAQVDTPFAVLAPHAFVPAAAAALFEA